MTDLRDCALLFDVDGTLLQAGNRYHHQALVSAVEDVCGRAPRLEQVALAGRTDTEILYDMVADTGAELAPDMLPRLFALAIAEFERCCPADLSEMVIEGVRPALEGLLELRPAMGLVTGNVEAVCRRKLAAAGLDRFFTFGAFGDESARRADLPPLALMRAGGAYAVDRTYVIGDTPRDIDCGLACGMKTVAVATGRYSLDELRACQPAFLCASLPEFVEALAGGRI